MGRHLLPMPFGGDLVSYKNARARRAANAEETNLFTMRRHCLLALLTPYLGPNENTAGHEPAVLKVFVSVCQFAFRQDALSKAVGWQAFVFHIHCEDAAGLRELFEEFVITMRAQAGDNKRIEVWTCKARDCRARHWHCDGLQQLAIWCKAVDVASRNACGPVVAICVSGCTIRSANGVIQLCELALVGDCTEIAVKVISEDFT